ncbi:MAG: HAMP domain-containing histidine kinase [Acidobacteria bacterium]|nr:HAMP domain-containing histidine kinase [Acidobacteriota bacterium]
MHNTHTAGRTAGNRGFRLIFELQVWLVILPTAALLAVGILMLVFWRAHLNLLFGILVTALVACLITGTVLALVLLRREAAVSRLQLDFVSKVSHELRTPLTSIRMFAEMLHTGSDMAAEERRLCLETLEREAVRLSEKIERLLDWGKMESGRRIYECRPTPPTDVVEGALQAFRAATVGAAVPVQVELDPELPEIDVDRGALVDALVNLLFNAHKYGGGDEPILLSVETKGSAVRFAVTDRGIGIPRREHRRIFEKFYRADDRLSREVGGSGLGLAIVRHVAKGHGGRVEVQSEPGKGSTFTIVVRRAKVPTRRPLPTPVGRMVGGDRD